VHAIELLLGVIQVIWCKQLMGMQSVIPRRRGGGPEMKRSWSNRNQSHNRQSTNGNMEEEVAQGNALTTEYTRLPTVDEVED
jgi:hypothetical protein